MVWSLVLCFRHQRKPAESLLGTSLLVEIAPAGADHHSHRLSSTRSFASQLKRRLRQGAKLIVLDPREIALVRTPHIEADYHLQLRPGTNAWCSSSR